MPQARQRQIDLPTAKLNAPHVGGADSGDIITPRQDNPLHMQQVLIFTRTLNFAEHTVVYLGRGLHSFIPAGHVCHRLSGVTIILDLLRKSTLMEL